MNILALDLATTVGWASSDGSSGMQNFKPRRGDSPGMRYLNLRAWLSRMHEITPFGLIAYEQAHHRGGYATEVLIGLATTVQAWAAEHGVETTSRRSGEIKMHALGTAKGTKLAMMLACEKKFGIEPRDDNHADAIWLLDLVRSGLDSHVDKS